MSEPSYVAASKRQILRSLGLVCHECGERTRGEKAGPHALGCPADQEGDRT